MKSANRYDSFILLIFIFLVAWALVGLDYERLSDPFRDGKVRALVAAAGVGAVWALWRCNPFWAAFAGYAVASWIWFDFEAYGMIDVVMIISALVAGDVLACKFNRRPIAASIAILSLLEGLYGFVQLIGFEPYFDLHQIPGQPDFSMVPIGTFGHNTFLGLFVALGAIYWVQQAAEKRSWQLYLTAALSIFFTIICDSTMADVALAAGLLYLLWRASRLYAAIALGAIISIGLVAFSAGYGRDFFSFSGRMSVWPLAEAAWLEAPYFGNGPGSWIGQLARWGATKDQIGLTWGQVHADFLQVLVEYGLVGFLIVAAGLGAFFSQAKKQDPILGAWGLALCANALANFPFHFASFGLIAGWLVCSVHHYDKN